MSIYDCLDTYVYYFYTMYIYMYVYVCILIKKIYIYVYIFVSWASPQLHHLTNCMMENYTRKIYTPEI